jgi:hypothetical protein
MMMISRQRKAHIDEHTRRCTLLTAQHHQEGQRCPRKCGAGLCRHASSMGCELLCVAEHNEWRAEMNCLGVTVERVNFGTGSGGGYNCLCSPATCSCGCLRLDAEIPEAWAVVVSSDVTQAAAGWSESERPLCSAAATLPMPRRCARAFDSACCVYSPLACGMHAAETTTPSVARSEP